MATIEISDELFERVDGRYKKLVNLFRGTGKIGAPTLDDFIERVLVRYCNRKDQQEKDNNKNEGFSWEKFKRENFNNIYLRDQGRCLYCRQRVARKRSTLDHKIPTSRGGSNIVENLTISCKWCNEDKGILTHEEYFYKQLVNASKGITAPDPNHPNVPLLKPTKVPVQEPANAK